MVDAITRTSTSIRASPPSREKRCSCSTRRILPWVSSGMSATWSSSSVPPSARSSSADDARLLGAQPAGLAPNSSMSTRSGARAAALRTTNGAAGAARLGVDQPRRDLLARARRAADQHARAGGRHALDRLAHPDRSPARCRSARSRRRPDARSSATSRWSRLASSARWIAMQQPVGLERLLDEVVGTLLDRGDRGLDRAVAAEHDHRHLGMVAP